MRWRVVRQVAITSLREFLRTPEAVFWTYGFPLVMAIALGLAFRSERQQPVPIVLEDLPQLAAQLERDPLLKVTMVAAGEGQAAFRRGKFTLLLRAGSDGTPVLLIDPTRDDSTLARLLVERAMQRPALAPPPSSLVKIEEQREPGSRYIDWLIPGLIGLNVLGAGMWGIGYNFVQLRVRQTLRRLVVTPMTRSEFLLGFISSRLLLTIPDAMVVVMFGWLVFGVPVRGSPWLLVLIVVAGALAFMGLGVLVASRARTTEGVGGLINLTTMPMWLLGGSFFANERFPDLLQPLVQALPLTWFNDAMRSVMLEGHGLEVVWPQLAALAVFFLLCHAIAVRIFRWT